MKILVLQLARLGDIYQSWPTLNALKRQGSEVHLLTRSSFAQAAPTFVDKTWTLDARAILSHVVDERPNIDASLAGLEELCDSLKAENFDRVINLSYSPFSASLTYEIAGDAEVIGYTRHSDRTLKIPDDASAYFYAQVGVGKANRLHVVDLFAHAAGVELTDADWAFGAARTACPLINETGRGGIVVHLGASNLAKTLSWSKWLQIVKGLLSKTDVPVILVGSAAEAEIAEKVSGVYGSRKPLNLVGRTSLQELYALVDAAALVVGGDSAPVQIASLTDTPVFNLSFPMVSLWETGPRAAGSRILPLESEDQFTSEDIVGEIVSTLRQTWPSLPVVRVPSRTTPYIETRPLAQSFDWKLVQALYMGEMFPAAPSSTFLLGLQRLEEVNLLAIEQIAALKKDPKNQTASLILNRADEVMDHVISLVPEIAPIVRWFRVERVRIAPMSLENLLTETRHVHERLADVLNLYTGVANENVVLDEK